MNPIKRELGTDRRDVPHKYEVGEDPANADCAVCDKSFTDARHQEWAVQQKALRQRASEGTLPREHG